ncbi:hypothetical protein [Herbiconiux solani]|uniref:hypothetical protein n=1 Tax=Herbiconiux solani TaxID=661329 RepID=UPI0008255E06|nr:hypothetical protein [Herbiconiux solani]
MTLPSGAPDTPISPGTPIPSATPSQTTPPPAKRMPAPPSVHVRAFLTWLVIFPEVALVNWALSPTDPLGPIVLRSLIVTLVVIPPAVYLFVPALLRLWTRHIPPHPKPDAPAPQREP